MACVLDVRGERDGIRWGNIRLGVGVTRHFQFCRLSGAVSLWTFDSVKDQDFVRDRDADRIAAAAKLLRAQIGVVRS